MLTTMVRVLISVLFAMGIVMLTLGFYETEIYFGIMGALMIVGAALVKELLKEDNKA